MIRVVIAADKFMTAPNLIRQDVPPPETHASLAAFAEVLGQQPKLWRREASGWTCWGGSHQGQADALQASNRFDAISHRLQAGEIEPEGIVTPLEPGRVLVALPVHDDCADWAAVSVLNSSDLPLVQKLASAALTLQRERTESIAALPGVIELLPKAPSLSELAWFRSIVDQVRLCDARIEHSHVADEVLPRLRNQIGAEAVAWVREVPGAVADAPAGPIIVWCGDSIVTDAESIEIVRKYGRRAMLKPAVCEVSDMSSDRRWPRLNGFILVRVPDNEAEGSWLLALNRQSMSSSAGGRDRQFSHFEAGLMQVAAAVLSTHARNLGVLHDREHVMQRVIYGMSGAIDARDAYTRGHSERVGRFAKRIGMELQLGTEDTEQLYLTGLLHDIGKIGIPDRVLLKSGSLTDEEFELIKQHPEIGHRILEPISELAYALPGVLHHHERIDGRGYPHGLSGAEIPLSARILAVADAFDAMTSTRTYRAAMTLQRATSILSDGRGVQWDTDIVEAFLTVMPKAVPAADQAGPTHSESVFDDCDDDAKDWASLSMIASIDVNDLPSAS